MKLYKKEELVSKYKGKFIDIYPHHFDYWNSKKGKYETVYEVRGVSSEIRENFNLPEDCVID